MPRNALLVPVQDIRPGRIPRYDFHMHTSWTDGANTANEMYRAAVTEGLETICFTEHARKTSGDWFAKFAAEIRALPASPCRALVGVETKVDDFEGNLDSTPEIIGACDLVMASVHRFPGETGDVKGRRGIPSDAAVEMEYRLSLAVLDNPRVDILGHPFGMSYRRFGTTPPEKYVLDVIAKAARLQVAFEINSRYHPDPWTLIAWCQEAGAPVSLGSNAHRIDEVGKIVRVLARREPA